ncbi:amidohydrolase family protein [Kineosporia babensis]
MDIVDAQLHLPTPARPWQHGDESLPDLQIEILLAQLDAAGVDSAVLVHTPHLFPAEVCIQAATAYPDRFATVLEYDESALDIAEQIADIRHRPGVVGARINTIFPPANAERLRAGAYENLLSAAETHGVPVCVLAAGNLTDVADVARTHPDLSLTIDHLGLAQPPFAPVDTSPWHGLDDLLSLAALPNVAVKLSGAPTLSTTGYPYPDIWPHLNRVLESFGVDRVMWGTDHHRILGRFPGMDPLPKYPGYHSYAQGLHYLLDNDQLTIDEKAALLGGTTRRILNRS